MTPRDKLLEIIAESHLSGWTAADAHNHVERLLLSLEYVPEAIEGRVLEVGAGHGRFTQLLRTFRKCTVDAVNREDCDFEREQSKSEAESYEMIIAMEVIEHLGRDPMAALWEWNRLLKPGGSMLITTPNAASRKALTRLLMHENPFTFPVFLRDGGTDRHNREYTVAEIGRMLVSSGFNVGTLTTHSVYGPDPFVPPVVGWDDSHRGDTIFAVGLRQSSPKERYPGWLYL